jgi:hypothetical protein
MGYESGTEAARERRRVRGLENQGERAAAAVMFALDALPAKLKCVVLNAALREALDDWTKQEARDAIGC